MLGKSFVTLQVLLDPNFPGQAYLPVQITEVPFFEGWYHFTFVRYHMVPAEILDWEGVEEGNPRNLEKMRRFLSHWIIVSKHMNLSRWLYYAPMGSISSTILYQTILFGYNPHDPNSKQRCLQYQSHLPERAHPDIGLQCLCQGLNPNINSKPQGRHLWNLFTRYYNHIEIHVI